MENSWGAFAGQIKDSRTTLAGSREPFQHKATTREPQNNHRATIEQLQSNYRATTEQLQSNYRAITAQPQIDHRAAPAQATTEQPRSCFRATIEPPHSKPQNHIRNRFSQTEIQTQTVRRTRHKVNQAHQDFGNW